MTCNTGDLPLKSTDMRSELCDFFVLRPLSMLEFKLSTILINFLFINNKQISQNPLSAHKYKIYCYINFKLSLQTHLISSHCFYILTSLHSVIIRGVFLVTHSTKNKTTWGQITVHLLHSYMTLIKLFKVLISSF